jgi:hypothetical protein
MPDVAIFEAMIEDLKLRRLTGRPAVATDRRQAEAQALLDRMLDAGILPRDELALAINGLQVLRCNLLWAAQNPGPPPDEAEMERLMASLLRSRARFAGETILMSRDLIAAQDRLDAMFRSGELPSDPHQALHVFRSRRTDSAAASRPPVET